MFDRHNREMSALRAKHCPVGAKVEFQIGLKWVEGVIDEHPGFEWQGEEVVVRNPKTRATHRKKIWEVRQLKNEATAKP